MAARARAIAAIKKGTVRLEGRTIHDRLSFGEESFFKNVGRTIWSDEGELMERPCSIGVKASRD